MLRLSASDVKASTREGLCVDIETILNDEVPIGLPYFYNYLAGNVNTFSGVYSSALGQMFFSAAAKNA